MPSVGRTFNLTLSASCKWGGSSLNSKPVWALLLFPFLLLLCMPVLYSRYASSLALGKPLERVTVCSLWVSLAQQTGLTRRHLLIKHPVWITSKKDTQQAFSIFSVPPPCVRAVIRCCQAFLLGRYRIYLVFGAGLLLSGRTWSIL